MYPAGYAYPNQQPLFPQAKAELMAGTFQPHKHRVKCLNRLMKHW